MNLEEILSRDDVASLSADELNYAVDETQAMLAQRFRDGRGSPLEATSPMLEAALDMPYIEQDRARWFAAIQHYWKHL